MFTGIITDLGQVRSVEKTGDWRFTIATTYDITSIEVGASICCSGVCLTAVEFGDDCFAVDVSEETISKTTLGTWQPGRSINLEKSLKLGDEMGGHIVSGHVDGLGSLVSKSPDGDSQRMVFAAERELLRFIAKKGSITIDGVSLTVNDVDDHQFAVNIIPHTQVVTTLGELAVGDAVNLEIDMLARYVARLTEMDKSVD